MAIQIIDAEQIANILKEKNSSLEDSRMYYLWWDPRLTCEKLPHHAGFSLYQNKSSPLFYLVLNSKPTECFQLEKEEIVPLVKATSSENEDKFSESFMVKSESTAKPRLIPYDADKKALKIENPWMYDEVSFLIDLKPETKERLLELHSKNIVSESNAETQIHIKHNKRVTGCKQRNLHNESNSKEADKVSTSKTQHYNPGFYQQASTAVSTKTSETAPLLDGNESDKNCCSCNVL